MPVSEINAYSSVGCIQREETMHVAASEGENEQR